MWSYFSFLSLKEPVHHHYELSCLRIQILLHFGHFKALDETPLCHKNYMPPVSFSENLVINWKYSQLHTRQRSVITEGLHSSAQVSNWQNGPWHLVWNQYCHKVLRRISKSVDCKLILRNALQLLLVLKLKLSEYDVYECTHVLWSHSRLELMK